MLTVAALVLVTILPQKNTALNSNTVSANRMSQVLTALRQYEIANGRLPCPADGTKPTLDSNYGIEAANNGATSNCGGGTPAANYTDATNHIAIGILPLRTLALPPEAAVDGYGRHITYAVDTNATECGWSAPTLTGGITVTDNGTATQSVVAMVSHGSDGHGAFIPLPGSSGTAVRLNTGSTDTDKLTNAHVDSSFNPTTVLNQFIKKIPTATFSDVVSYSNPNWNINSLPSSITKVTAVTPPANGTYTTGNYLTFTLTYGATVTVTGTPRIALTVIGSAPNTIGPSGTGYATYLSGSGTNTLTFRYTVLSTDKAANGLTMASKIDPNGGSIKAGTTCVYGGFSASNLSGVKLGGTLAFYVADSRNARIQKLDLTGTYQSKIDMPQLSGETQAPGPSGVALDSSGNIWVGDTPNHEIKEYDSSGNLLQRFGSYGTSGNGNFAGNMSIAIDTSNNLFVLDATNCTIQKFNSSGTWQATYGSAGSGNGQMSNPQMLALDGSGNMFVADNSNGRIIKFNASGVFQSNIVTGLNGNTIVGVDGSGNIYTNYQNNIQEYSSGGSLVRQFGGNGSSNGLFQSPMAITIDTSGNTYIADGTSRVQKFDSTGTYQSQFGSFGNATGQFNYPLQMVIH